eukprot:6213844-Pleurochrysis_carterae.AAC.1
MCVTKPRSIQHSQFRRMLQISLLGHSCPWMQISYYARRAEILVRIFKERLDFRVGKRPSSQRRWRVPTQNWESKTFPTQKMEYTRENRTNLGVNPEVSDAIAPMNAGLV